MPRHAPSSSRRRGPLFIALVVSILAHAALIGLLLRRPLRPMRGPPPSPSVVLMVQNTPTVGGPSHAARHAKPRPPAPPPLPLPPPPPPPVAPVSKPLAGPAPLPRRPRVPSPASHTAAKPPPRPVRKPKPAPPSVTTRPTPSVVAVPAAPPEVRLGHLGTPGTGIVTGPHVIPARPTAPIFNAPPAYPSAAVTAGQSGTVTLLIHVDANGHPTAVDITRSSGYPLLDQAARRALLHWRFVAARENGQAVASTLPWRVEFTLK